MNLLESVKAEPEYSPILKCEIGGYEAEIICQ